MSGLAKKEESVLMIPQLEEVLNHIPAPDQGAMTQAKAHWDGIAKPLGSLGKLEDALVQLAGIQRTPRVSLRKKALIVLCADNGVVEEGVSQSGQEITAIVAENFLDNKACVSLMCQQAGVDLFPVDIGMAVDTPRVEKRKIAYGTQNMTKGPAMSRDEAERAILVGIEKVKALKEQGYTLIATGEMGIGNTTTSSAMTAVLLDIPPARVVGRGAGLSSQGLERKIRVIETAIACNQPSPEDPIGVLAALGGLDIAGLVGVFLGGARYGVAVVIDGFISAVAALTALRLAPACAPYLLASHVSREPGARLLMEALKKEAFLTCDLALGEGSGAVALFPLLDLAAAVYHRMSSFDDAGFAQYEHLE